jgi:hypothetical protein
MIRLISYLNNHVRAECLGFGCFKPKPSPPPPARYMESCFDFEGECTDSACQRVCRSSYRHLYLPYGGCRLRENRMMCCCRNYG